MRLFSAILALVFAFTQTAWAFCGFYVATNDQPLTNKASRVVLAHEGQRTMVTMSSDIGGDPKNFAIVVPVPTVIQRDQVRLVKPETVEHLAAFSKPRLVEYYDDERCPPLAQTRKVRLRGAAAALPSAAALE
mgnify:CR=1 FL=1